MGSGLTVTITEFEQPPAVVYIMVVVPPLIPVTIPVEPTVATLVMVLSHVPPALMSESEVVEPAQRTAVPVIGAGSGLTVTTIVAIQPAGGAAYVIVAVPRNIPVTVSTPEEVPLRETFRLVVLQVPPGASASNVVPKRHIFGLPFIGDGLLSTVTIVVA